MPGEVEEPCDFRNARLFLLVVSEKGLVHKKKNTPTKQLLQLLKTQDPPLWSSLAHAMPAQPSSCYYVLVPLA